MIKPLISNGDMAYFHSGLPEELLYDASQAKKHGCLPLLPQYRSPGRYDLLLMRPGITER